MQQQGEPSTSTRPSRPPSSLMERDGLKLDYLGPAKNPKRPSRSTKYGPRDEEDEILLSEDDVPRRPPAQQPTIMININSNISPIRVKVDAAQDDLSPSYKELVELTKRVASDSWWGTYGDLYLGARWKAQDYERRKLHAVDWRGKAVECVTDLEAQSNIQTSSECPDLIVEFKCKVHLGAGQSRHYDPRLNPLNHCLDPLRIRHCEKRIRSSLFLWC